MASVQVKDIIDDYALIIGTYDYSMKTNAHLLGTIHAGAVIPADVQKAKDDIESIIYKNFKPMERTMIKTQATLLSKKVSTNER